MGIWLDLSLFQKQEFFGKVSCPPQNTISGSDGG